MWDKLQRNHTYDYPWVSLKMLLITSLAKEVMCLVVLVCLFVCLSVCLWTTLLKKLKMDWDEILKKGSG